MCAFYDGWRAACLVIHMVPKSSSAWHMIIKGRVDVYFDNELVAKTDLERDFADSMHRIASTSEPFSTTVMYCLFSRKHPDSRKILIKLDKVLQEMKDSGEMGKILMK